MVNVRRVLVAAATIALFIPITMFFAASPAQAVAVGNEAALKSNFANASVTQIDLTANITLDDCTGNLSRTSANRLTIDGHGFTITNTCDNHRIFLADGDGGLTVQNITLTGGDSDGFGGAIHYKGNADPGLLVESSIITGNHAVSAGGGLEADQIVLRNSQMSNNTSDDFCAAICSATTIDVIGSSITDHPDSPGSTLIATGSELITITGSSIVGNVEGGLFGGAGVDITNSVVANNTGSIQSDNEVVVVNSTITGNTGTGEAIDAVEVTLVYATVVDNEATDASASNIDARSLTSFGSVVALPNAELPNCVVETTTSEGFNYSDDDSCGFTVAGEDRENGLDPMLGALADNGGATQTRRPADASPLTNFIPTASCQNGGAADVSRDQVATERPQQTGCEIGAFEIPAPAPPPGQEPPPEPPPTEPPPAEPAQPVPAQPRLTG